MKNVILSFLVLTSSFSAHAGPFSDELSRCLVRSTTETDQVVLIRWIFAAMSAHPEVNALSKITAEQNQQLNQEAADLFVDLLAKRCQTETSQAVKYEGEKSIESSFSVLGQVAMQGLMSHKNVVEFLSGLERSMDKETMEKAFKNTPQKAL
jgi:hypothetical protein